MRASTVMAWPEVASSDSASSGVASCAASPAARPEKGACNSLTIRSFALVTTGASAIRAKSRAAASGPMSKFPTDTIRRSALTTTGLDWEEFSSSWRMFPA